MVSLADLYMTLLSHDSNMVEAMFNGLDSTSINSLLSIYRDIELKDISDAFGENILDASTNEYIDLYELMKEFEFLSEQGMALSANPFGWSMSSTLTLRRMNTEKLLDSVKFSKSRISDRLSINPSMDLVLEGHVGATFSGLVEESFVQYLNLDEIIFSNSLVLISDTPVIDIVHQFIDMGSVNILNSGALQYDLSSLISQYYDNYDKLELISNNDSPFKAISNSFHFNLDINNFFVWGVRNKAGEIPPLIRTLLHMLNISFDSEYLTETILREIFFKL